MVTDEARELYEAYHDAMGNWERVPFDHLTVREMNAWQTATGHTSELEAECEALQQKARELESELEDAHGEATEKERDIDDLIRKRDDFMAELEPLMEKVLAALPPPLTVGIGDKLRNLLKEAKRK